MNSCVDKDRVPFPRPETVDCTTGNLQRSKDFGTPEGFNHKIEKLTHSYLLINPPQFHMINTIIFEWRNKNFPILHHTDMPFWIASLTPQYEDRTSHVEKTLRFGVSALLSLLSGREGFGFYNYFPFILSWRWVKFSTN